jgi:hypothetical protein
LPITTALRWALGRAPPASVRRPGSRDGISYAGGVGFRDDPHQVHVAELDLRPTERFVYDYDFTDGWRLDLCLEQILAAEAGRVYPRCTGGRRSGPPEGCGGSRAFTEYTRPHLIFGAVLRAAALLQPLLDDDLATPADHRDQLAALLPLLGLERFDRRAVNRALAGLTEK